MRRILEMGSLFVVSVACLFLGLWSFGKEVRVSSILFVGSQLQAGKVIDPQSASLLMGTQTTFSERPSCRNDLLMAESLISVGVRDAMVQSGAPESIPLALKGMSETAKGILDCSPGWGMAWASLAISDAQLGVKKENLKSYLERSQWLSPSEYWVISSRLQASARISSWFGSGFEGVLRSDVRSLLISDVGPSLVAGVMGPVFSFIEPVAQSEYARVEDARRQEALMLAFGPWYANIAACKPVYFRDWLYRGMRGSCVDEKYLPKMDWR